MYLLIDCECSRIYGKFQSLQNANVQRSELYKIIDKLRKSMNLHVHMLSTY